MLLYECIITKCDFMRGLRVCSGVSIFILLESMLYVERVPQRTATS